MYFAGIRQVAVSIVVLAAGLIASMALIEWVQRTVSRYHPLAFEEAARNALAEGDQALAVNICTGNLHYAKNRFPSYGLCRLLRARGYFGLGERDKACEDLVAAERYWRTWHRRADASERAELKELATEMAMAALGSGEADTALQLVSLAGTGSGAPLACLTELRDKLSPQMRARIWPDEELLLVENFARTGEPLLETWAERTGRMVDSECVDAPPQAPGDSGRGMRLTASPATKNGMSWYSVPFFMPVPETPCRFRAVLDVNAGRPPRLQLGHSYPATGQGGTTFGEPPVQLANGQYTVEVLLPGHDPAEAPDYVVRIGFALPSEACEFVIRRIELLSGEGAIAGSDGQK